MEATCMVNLVYLRLIIDQNYSIRYKSEKHAAKSSPGSPCGLIPVGNPHYNMQYVLGEYPT